METRFQDFLNTIKLVDQLAAKCVLREKMFEVYAKVCVLEPMFWKSAYKQEQWPASIEAIHRAMYRATYAHAEVHIFEMVYNGDLVVH